MPEQFQKPFAAPPSIFGLSLLLSLPCGWMFPYPILPFWLQLVLGAAAVLAGVALIRASMRSIMAADTTYDPFATSTALVTSGIYRYSRNPGYLGLAFIQAGFAFLFDNPWVLLGLLVAVFVTSRFVIRLEEEKLAAAFGEAYLNYTARVRRWI